MHYNKAGVEGNVAAQKFLLCNRAPEKWKNTRRHKIESPEKAEPAYAALIKSKKEQERVKGNNRIF